MAQDKILAGYEQSIGAKLQMVVDHFGPTSYNSTTGDIYPATNVNRGGFDRVSGGPSLSGTYQAVPIIGIGNVGAGVPTVALRWYALSIGNVISTTITAGGTYTGTAPTVTFSAAPTGGVTATGVAVLNTGGTAVIGITITNPGKGYVTAPTITFSAGGATATAALSIAGEVANGTNLSAEAVRLEMLMY